MLSYRVCVYERYDQNIIVKKKAVYAFQIILILTFCYNIKYYFTKMISDYILIYLLSNTEYHFI